MVEVRYRKKVKRKDEKEVRFEKYYHEYADRIYHVCVHFARNEKDASYLLHEAFLKFYERMDELEEEGSEIMLAYLATTVKRLWEKQQQEFTEEEGRKDMWIAKKRECY